MGQICGCIKLSTESADGKAKGHVEPSTESVEYGGREGHVEVHPITDSVDGNAKGHVELGCKVTVDELLEMARNNTNAVRCGLTNKPHRRKNEYSHEGYNGMMYYACTDDTKRDEQKLLDLKVWPKNKQQQSNGKHEPGYVYILIA